MASPNTNEGIELGTDEIEGCIVGPDDGVSSPKTNEGIELGIQGGSGSTVQVKGLL